MREACAHPFAFVHTAGGTPCLHARDWRAGIFLYNQSEAVLERKYLGATLGQSRLVKDEDPLREHEQSSSEIRGEKGGKAFHAFFPTTREPIVLNFFGSGRKGSTNASAKS